MYTPPPAAWPENLEGHSLSFASAGAAITWLRAHLDIPVALPSPLPAGAHLAPKGALSLLTLDGRRSAQLTLVLPSGQQVLIQFGVAVFDGCGADSAVAARVGDQPALLNVNPGSADVIWPATPGHPEGRYGIGGPFTEDEVLALAGSMDVAARAAATDVGC